MKKTKSISKPVKALSISLALASFVISLGGCGGGSGNEEPGIAEGKEGVIVGVYDGALGYDWAHELEKMYEAKHSDVDIVIRHEKDKYDDGVLLSSIENSDVDMYFLSENTLNSYTAAGLVADLTDVVTEKIYDDDGNMVDTGATKSIEDTLWQQWREIYKTDGKYYAIPNFSPVAGVWYDADLFEDAGYTVPTTYSEFEDLLDAMIINNHTPFTVSSSNQYVINNSATSFHANLEGKENFWLNSTFSGTDSALGEITPENAAKLANQEGHAAALQFLYDIAVNDSYTTASSKGGQSHLQAQEEFVRSINAGGSRVAMILENSFWEREVKGTIEDMGASDSDLGWGKRNFKYMVAPVNNKKTNKQTVYMGFATSYVCMKANSERLDAAKDFLRFAQSREALVKYTQYTSTLRPYDYEFTEEEYNACTTMTKSMIDLKRDANVEFVTHAALSSVNKVIPEFSDTWFYSDGFTRIPYQNFQQKNTPVSEFIQLNIAANAQYFG